MAVFKSSFAGGKPKYGKLSGSASQPCTGVHLHDFSVEIPTSAQQNGDGVLLWKFPDDHDAYLLFGGLFQSTTGSGSAAPENLFRVDLDDLDGGSALVWSLGIATAADGVVDTGIIVASTVGQSAGKDFADDGTTAGLASGGPFKVDGNYLVWDPTTSPTTATEGTIRVRMVVAYGLKAETDSSLV